MQYKGLPILISAEDLGNPIMQNKGLPILISADDDLKSADELENLKMQTNCVPFFKYQQSTIKRLQMN